MYKDNVVAVPSAILQNPVTPTPEVLAEGMVLIDVMHFDFHQKIHAGQIVVHQLVMDDVRLFFRTAFELRFPIQSIVPVSFYNWNDYASCAANNSSGHNMRFIDGTQKLSKHSIGCAFDINPRQNPCFVLEEDTLRLKHVIPEGCAYSPGQDGVLQKGDPLVSLMLERGWSWGGNWTFPKDYQHFQIVPPELASYVE